MSALVQHHVLDFDVWRAVFTEHQSIREQYGCRNHRLYQCLDDPGDVTIVLGFPARERAEAFYRDPSLREAMQRGGVDGGPRVTLLEAVEAAEYAKRKTA